VTHFKGSANPSRCAINSRASGRVGINDKHRLVYQVTNDALIIASCRFHY